MNSQIQSITTLEGRPVDEAIVQFIQGREYDLPRLLSMLEHPIYRVEFVGFVTSGVGDQHTADDVIRIAVRALIMRRFAHLEGQACPHRVRTHPVAIVANTDY